MDQDKGYDCAFYDLSLSRILDSVITYIHFTTANEQVKVYLYL